MSDKRRVKFKTLDNQVHELEVPHNISIFDLKKIIMIKNGMPLEGQRLIFQGKQLKNEQLLSDYIHQDDQIIHLMCLTSEQIASLRQHSNQSQTTHPQAQSQPLQQTINANANMNSASIVSMLHNMLNNNTSMPIQNIFASNQGGNGNGLFINPHQTLHQPLLQPIPNSNQSQPETHNAHLHPHPRIINPHSSYPISTHPTDSRYNDLLQGINQTLDHLSSNLNKNNQSSIQAQSLPVTNSVQNILTAVSRSLKYYNENMYQFIPQLDRLTDLLEREQLITKSEDRTKGNELIQHCSTSLDLISQSSQDLNQIIINSNFGNAPNSGYVNVMNTEIGIIASMSLPFDQQIAYNNGTNNNMTAMNQSNNNNNMNQGQSGRINPIQMITTANNNEIRNSNQRSNDANGININNVTQSNSQSDSVIIPEENMTDVLNKIMKDSQLKKTTFLKDTASVIPFKPHSLFASFVNNILVNMSFQEIANLLEFNLSGISKQSEAIFTLVSSENKDTLLSRTIEFLIYLITIRENDQHKKKENKIDIPTTIKKYTISFYDILFKNCISTVWENSIRGLFISFINELYSKIAQVYTTGNEGSLYCFIQNTEALLLHIIGEKWVTALKQYDPNIIAKSIEEIVNFSLKNQAQTDCSLEPELEPLSMTEILNIASNDKERLAKTTLPDKQFSQTYHNSSLFKD